MSARDFAPLRVDGRDDMVRAELARLGEAGCDALIVVGSTNNRWLTGFTGSSSLVVVGPDETVLLTDGRYSTQAPRQLDRAGSPARVEIAGDVIGAATDVVSSEWTVALEDTMPWRSQRRWADQLRTEPVASSELVEELRAVKTAPEIERMQAAAAIVDEALADVMGLLEPGTTERDFALALDDGMRARGASGPAYETIVASGPNAALPHARPTDRAFSGGDLLIVDAGAIVDGYRSDMTRTFVIDGAATATAGGSAPGPMEMLEVVTRSQAAGVAGVAPEVEAAAVDAICREVIEAADMGEAFVHGTGHGVGLDIHELPRVRKGSAAILRPGHVLTVEPGVYFPDVGGVRVEDTVVVTENGCRALTRFPKTTIAD